MGKDSLSIKDELFLKIEVSTCSNARTYPKLAAKKLYLEEYADHVKVEGSGVSWLVDVGMRS